MSAPRTREMGLIAYGHISEDRACTGKRSYASKNDAQHAVKVAARHKITLYRYRCPFCANYHTTRTPQPGA